MIKYFHVQYYAKDHDADYKFIAKRRSPPYFKLSLL